MMLNSILDAVVNSLNQENIRAFRDYPERRFDTKSGISVSVGIENCKYLSSGMGEYLGIRSETDGNGEIELFGKKLELILGFEIFSPFGSEFGADACIRCADSLRSCFSRLPSGIKALEMNFGEVKADEKISAFRCLCRLKCMVFLVAESNGNDTEFLDFILKGTVNSGN